MCFNGRANFDNWKLLHRTQRKNIFCNIFRCFPCPHHVERGELRSSHANVHSLQGGWDLCFVLPISCNLSSWFWSLLDVEVEEMVAVVQALYSGRVWSDLSVITLSLRQVTLISLPLYSADTSTSDWLTATRYAGLGSYVCFFVLPTTKLVEILLHQPCQHFLWKLSIGFDCDVVGNRARCLTVPSCCWPLQTASCWWPQQDLTRSCLVCSKRSPLFWSRRRLSLMENNNSPCSWLARSRVGSTSHMLWYHCCFVGISGHYPLS